MLLPTSSSRASRRGRTASFGLACCTAALRELKLAVAYPAFAGASITLIVLVSAWLFEERITAENLVGAALVMVGIVALTR